MACDKDSLSEVVGRPELDGTAAEAAFGTPGGPRASLLAGGRLAVVQRPIRGKAVDFDFAAHFDVRSLAYAPPTPVATVARMGMINDYAALHAQLAAENLVLVNSPGQHDPAANLSGWWPRLADLTPRSRVFPGGPPDADLVEAEFGWPCFVRLDSRTFNKSAASVARSRETYLEISAMLREAGPVAVREFVELEPLPPDGGPEVFGRLRPSVEIRSFWWKGSLAGLGPYWAGRAFPALPAADLAAAASLARRAAALTDVPFLVVDLAKAVGGVWLVVECNDAQESAYCGLEPLPLWQAILRLAADGDADAG